MWGGEDGFAPGDGETLTRRAGRGDLSRRERRDALDSSFRWNDGRRDASLLPALERRGSAHGGCRGKDEGDGGGFVAHGGTEGDEEAASARSHEGGGEYDGCLSEPVLHGSDGAGVVGSWVVGKGDDGCAGARGEGP